MKRMRIVVITIALICAVVLVTFPRGSVTAESQPGCPANGPAFQVDYFGFPLKDYWKCQISQESTQGGSVTFYKSGSIFKVATDAAIGLAVVLLPAVYLAKRAPK